MPVASRVISWARVSKLKLKAPAASAMAPSLGGAVVTQYWAIKNTMNTM